MTKNTVTIGADPEFFLYDKSKRMYVSCHDLLPGTKEAPYKLSKGAVQVDGTAVEFNINPARTSDEFVSNIATTLKEIREMVPEKYEFRFTPYVTYKEKYFNELPEHVKLLGCDPDFSAMTLLPIKRDVENIGSFRTGSGHIHVGWGENLEGGTHLSNCSYIVKKFEHPYSDCFRNVESRSKPRQVLYGQPGAFRPKPYGVEYRVPSNAWLKHPESWSRLFYLFKEVTEFEMKGAYYSSSRWM